MDPMQRKRIIAATAIATAIAVPAEGLRRIAYYDPVGILTTCYGATKNVIKGKVYSLAECKAMLNRDMLEAVETVERCAPGLPIHTLAAFGDAVYNVGPTIACDTQKSTAARLLKKGDVVAACQQLPRWNKATVAGVKVVLPGLTKRRNDEMAVCLQGLA